MAVTTDVPALTDQERIAEEIGRRCALHGIAEMLLAQHAEANCYEHHRH
jgi:hypothetical protein